MLTESYFFAPFRLDMASERLWRNDVPVSLRPKAFALLRYLVERPQRLVTKEALLEALWPDVVVSEDVLKSHVKDVRQALGDLAKTPLFIETVHRRGYRFIAEVSPRPVPLRAVAPTSSVEAPAALGPAAAKPSASSSAAAQRHDLALFVGRQPELSRLEQELGRALSGTLRIIFISGEAGIGKTTLVQRALAKFQSSGAWFTSGQCISSHGPGEAYLPLLEALGRLCRGAHGDAVVELLRRYAPSWLAKLPELLDAETLALLERVLFGSGPERMLRELASVLPLLTKVRPLVLVLEDLQWADPSTLVLLDYLARGTELPALLVVGTYRPQDLESMDHPLRAMLQHSRGRGRSQEIELERLTPAEVAEYLDGRFDGHAFPAELARHLHARTGGSPLFLVCLIDALVESGALNGDVKPWRQLVGLETIARQVPTSLSAMIEAQLQRLGAHERAVLEAASVVGFEFGSSAVAYAIDGDVDVTERLCSDWAQRRLFIRSKGLAVRSRDGVSLQFEFNHALYQQVLYERSSPRRRVALHRRVAEFVAAEHEGDAGDIAPSLAVHLEKGHLYSSAVRQRHLAGEHAVGRSAFAEAIGHFSAGMRLLEKVPDPHERRRRELDLSVGLGVPLVMTLGYAAPRVQQVYARVSELCVELGETARLANALAGIVTFHLARAEYSSVVDLGERLVELVQPSPMACAHAQFLIGMAYNCQGQFVAASRCFERAVAFAEADPEPYSQVGLYPQDPGIASRSLLGLMQWYTGEGERAVRTAEDALGRARSLAQPSGLAFALNICCFIRNYRSEPALALQHARELTGLSVEQGFAYWLAFGTLHSGIAQVRLGDYASGLETLRRGCDLYLVTGASLGLTLPRTELARALAAVGDHQGAWRVIDDVFADINRTDERFYEPELCRLCAQLCRADGDARPLPEQIHAAIDDDARNTLPSKTDAANTDAVEDGVVAWLEAALRSARRSEGRSFELHAALDLARHWSERRRAPEARQLVLATLRRMPAGADPAVLREAQRVLAGS